MKSGGDNSTVTRDAIYLCTTRLHGQTEKLPIEKSVTVAVIAGEDPAKTRERFEQAAQNLAKTIQGCNGAIYKSLIPTEAEQRAATEAAKAKAATQPVNPDAARAMAAQKCRTTACNR